MLLVRRDGTKVSFSLRAGVGTPVAKAPWKVEWGGGASVENPHYQRVHYCDLLVTQLRPLLCCFLVCCVAQQKLYLASSDLLHIYSALADTCFDYGDHDLSVMSGLS